MNLLERFPQRLAISTVNANPDPVEMNQLLWAEYWMRTIREAINHLRLREQIDHLLIPFFDDYCLHAASFRRSPFGSIQWSGIVVRPRHHLRSCGAKLPFRWIDLLDRAAYSLVLRKRSLVRLFSIDPFLSQYYPGGKVAAIPDPANVGERQAGRTPTELDPLLIDRSKRVVLLVYGYIDGRKGLQELMAAVNDSQVPRSLHILLAGFQDPAAAGALGSPIAQALRVSGRLVEINRVVTDDEETALFQFADIVWVYYPRSYCSSGALIRAGQCAKPVLATEEGLVGRLVTDIGAGMTAPEGNFSALRDALVALAKDPELRLRQGRAGREHFARSTPEAFATPVIDSIVNSFTGPA